jgi:phosphatidylglycerophosphate synthase
MTSWDETAGRTGVRSALEQLRSAQKPSQGTPAYSRFVNRPIGRYLAAVAFTSGLSPNQVSLLSATSTAAAITLLALGGTSWAVGLGVCLLLALGYALDSADGQVARLSGRGSRLGEWLDHMIDCAKLSTLHAAVAVHLYRSTELDHRWLLVPLGSIIVGNLIFFGMMLTDQMRRAAGPSADPGRTGASLSLLRAFAVLPTDFGALVLVFLLLGWPRLFVAGYTLLLAGSVPLLVAALARWARMLHRLDVEAASVTVGPRA